MKRIFISLCPAFLPAHGVATPSLERLSSMFSATKRKARRFALTRHRNTMLHFFAGKLDFPCCAWTAQVTDKRWPESELFPELPAGNEAAQIREAVNYDPNGFGDSMAEGALYPFGFGLSCTIFEYSGLEISPKNIPANGEVTVRCLIKNIGGRVGDEVAQLYIHQPTSNRSVEYDSLPGIGVGITGLGMSEAIVIGAFAFALN